VVPPGAAPGTTIQVVAPSGNSIQVRVPDGVGPGGKFMVQDHGAQGSNMVQDAVGAGQDIFNGESRLFIKQRMEMMELCGIEAKQHYDISVAQGNAGSETAGPVFLNINEESDCCERICCGPNRSLTLKLHSGTSKDGPTVLSMKKPFSCQGCCCLRPAFEVSNGKGELLGKIDDPCRWCLMDQQVMKPSGEVLFTTKGSICQLGIFCPCCGGVNFDVLKGETKVAAITKMPMDCEEMCLKTNRFVVDFDHLTDPLEKQMLFASAMLLDLEYFEQQK